VYTSPLHINGSSSIAACVFVDAVMCLPNRCLAKGVCSGSTIPALRRHVTILHLKVSVQRLHSTVDVCYQTMDKFQKPSNPKGYTRKRQFITTRHSFAVKSPLFCAIFTSYRQQTLNNQATIMKFMSDIYKTINFDVIKVLLVQK
jgi:hypothetical protein